MFCGSCGMQVPDGQNFCPNCGAAMGSAQSTGQPQAAQQPVAQPYQQPYDQLNTQQGVQPYQQPFGQQGVQQQPVQQQMYGQAGAPQAYQQPPQPYGQPYPQYQQPQMGYGAAPGVNPNYQKLGGWLLFFVIMFIIGGVGSLISVVNDITAIGSLPRQYGPMLMASAAISLIEAGLIIGLVVLIFQRKDIFLKYYQIVRIIGIVLSIILTAVTITSFSGTLDVGVAGASAVGSAIGGILGLVLFTLYFCKSVRVRTYMGSTSYIDKALFRIGA